VKSGNDYFRFPDGRGTPCGLDRASVFPPQRLEEVLALAEDLRQRGFPQAGAVRLRITETPL
jgi:hypothetical protein